MIWFTSDTHFGHANIITYCKRPFENTWEMDRTLIENWNSRVDHADEIYHIGDFAFASPERQKDIFYKLKGKKHLIVGNHDKKPTFDLPWVTLQTYAEIKLPNEQVKTVLFHYGLRVWNRSHHGALALYGHSHGTLPGNSQSCDVGVDCWDYHPVNIDEIRARLSTLPNYGSVDHHGKAT